MAANGESTQATVTTTFQPVFNAAVPKEGPKAIPLRLDFTAVETILVDLTQQQQAAKISFLQGAFIDNSQNLSSFSIRAGQSQQTITIPPQSQAFVPLLLPNPPQFLCSSLGSAIVTIVVLNIPMDIAVWSVNGEAEVLNGMLQVQDAALEALISGGALTTADKNLAAIIQNLGGGNALDVNVVSGGGGGSGFNFQGLTKINAFGGGNIGLTPGVAGDFGILQYLHIYLDPTTFLVGSPLVIVQVLDNSAGGPIIAEFNFLPPATAPIAPANPILLWSADDMNISTLTTGSAFVASAEVSGSTANLSGAGLIFSYGWNTETTP